MSANIFHTPRMFSHIYKPIFCLLWSFFVLQVAVSAYEYESFELSAAVRVNESSTESISQINALTVQLSGVCSASNMRLGAHCACYYVYTQPPSQNTNDPQYQTTLHSTCEKVFGMDISFAQSSCSMLQITNKASLDTFTENMVISCSSVYDIEPEDTSERFTSPSTEPSLSTTPSPSTTPSTTPSSSTTPSRSTTPSASKSLVVTPTSTPELCEDVYGVTYYWWSETYIWVYEYRWIQWWETWFIVRYYWRVEIMICISWC